MDSSSSQILCCYCGCLTNPLNGNACTKCYSLRHDVSQGIRKLAYINFCRFCNRYLEPPNRWVYYETESKELLACCLKKFTGLKNVNLINAEFIPTDVHSKQLKIKLTVQKNLSNNSIAESIFNVDVKIIKQMCTDCHRIEAKDFWKAVVQLRQHVSHKKTFLYLEQVILKRNADKECNNIKQHKDGLDFFFNCKQHAQKFVTFISKYVPIRYTVSEQLISHDSHSNTYNYKHSYSVEIVPICKHDVVCISRNIARSYGLNNQLLLCNSVTNLIHLIDPITSKSISMDSNTYWKEPFYSVFTIKKASLFTIIQIEDDYHNYNKITTVKDNHKFKIVDVTLIRNTSWDGNDEVICKSHLGSIIQCGDTVECFDLTNTNINNDAYDSIDIDNRPEIIIIRKHYGDRTSQKRRQRWKLKQLKMLKSDTLASNDGDVDEFLKDIADDMDMRKNVDIYTYKQMGDASDDKKSNFLDCNIDEMVIKKLDDLNLDE